MYEYIHFRLIIKPNDLDKNIWHISIVDQNSVKTIILTVALWWFYVLSIKIILFVIDIGLVFRTSGHDKFYNFYLKFSFDNHSIYTTGVLSRSLTEDSFSLWTHLINVSFHLVFIFVKNFLKMWEILLSNNEIQIDV